MKFFVATLVMALAALSTSAPAAETRGISSVFSGFVSNTLSTAARVAINAQITASVNSIQALSILAPTIAGRLSAAQAQLKAALTMSATADQQKQYLCNAQTSLQQTSTASSILGSLIQARINAIVADITRIVAAITDFIAKYGPTTTTTQAPTSTSSTTTTQAPTSTSSTTTAPAPPADSPAPPADSPAPPADSSAPPADSPAPPADSSAPPADSPAPPADSPAPPADSPAPPSDSPAPAGAPASDAPAADSPAPADAPASDAPAADSPAPADAPAA